MCVRCHAPATVVDHIAPHRGDQALFWDKGNWQPLCKPCHDRAKQGEEKRSARGGVLAHPFLRPSRVPVTLVCGPPGSGKSTYVEKHRRPGDIVIDLDLIKAKLFHTTSHQAPRSAEATRQALLERNQILTGLADDHLHEHVWFIVSAPEQAERDLWQRKLRNARLVVMDTPLEECLRRIRADVSREGQRDWMEDLVHQWFARARREKDLRNV
ncbi:AAA family ATPase [Aquabacter cavernae]|uniref:AAA family ATPase n=1 Tax=Aquabacter cavernae TaxID=2496029 RepID=UPI003083F470